MHHAVIINHNAGSPYHGPNFRSYYAAKGWVDKGMKVSIVCSSFSHKLSKLPEVSDSYGIEMIDGIRYIWLKTKPFFNNIGRLRNYFEFYKKLKSIDKIIKEKVDFIICSSPPPFWIWECRRFADIKQAKLIFEARDLWPDVIFETTRLGILNPAAWIMKLAELKAYKCSDRVVSVNESALEIMGKRGVDKAKFWAIPNGTSLDKNNSGTDLSENVTDLFRNLKSEGFFIVGYSGALSKVYGIEYLVEAARALRNEKIAFVLAGTGPNEKELKNIAEKLSNIYLTGWIPKSNLHSFLTSVDICYAGLLNVPSFVFGSDSTKLYEYMKAEKPIIHAIGDEKSTVARAECGYRVLPENAESLADGIKKMSGLNNDELKSMGDKGYEFVCCQRNYDALTNKWISLFDSLNDKDSHFEKTIKKGK